MHCSRNKQTLKARVAGFEVILKLKLKIVKGVKRL